MAKITASQFNLNVPQERAAADALDGDWDAASSEGSSDAPTLVGGAPEPTEIGPTLEPLTCPECSVVFTSSDAVFCPFDGARLLRQPVSELADPMLGRVLDGRYQVLGRLGEGGMGSVYRVTHTTLGKQFAVKLLRSELARDAELSQRFIREARAMAQISNPHVIQVTDFGEIDDGRPFFVMELLSGRSLSALLREKQVPPAVALIVARRVAEALAAAHAVGVIHRDLKPDNVYVDPDSLQVKVLDFGLAHVVGTSRLTRSGVVFGTPQYMSPEQASGGDVDHRADIYALGIALYEMLAGRVPFEADSYMGVLTKQMYTAPAPLPPVVFGEAAMTVSGEGSEPAQEIEALVRRCLEKKPEARFQSMQQVMDALDNLLRCVPAVSSLAGPVSSRASRPAAANVDGARSQRTKLWPWLLVAVFLLGMGLWGWYGTPGPSTPVLPPKSAAEVPVTVPRSPVVRPLVQGAPLPAPSAAGAAQPAAALPSGATQQPSARPPTRQPPRKPASGRPRAPQAPVAGIRPAPPETAKPAPVPRPATPLGSTDLIDPWSQQ